MAASAKRNELLNYIDFDSLNVEHTVNPKRIFKLNSFEIRQKPMLYLMTREQRPCGNWGLIFAHQLAVEYNQPLCVIFFLDKTLSVNSRKLSFMIDGIGGISKELKSKNISFSILIETQDELITFMKKIDFGSIVVDFCPLVESKTFNERMAKRTHVACFEVDSHNIIPCRYLSQKQEFAAATIRPKVKTSIYEFLTEYPKITPLHKKFELGCKGENYSLIEDKEVQSVEWLNPGFTNANITLKNFISNKLDFYSEYRNDPTKYALSDLSPYLHFGQISSQKIALEILKSDSDPVNKEEFLEELIVRKELADNFCFYNQNYKNINSIATWAQETLLNHKNDIRTYIYSKDEFEKAKTHDGLWNAAQLELLKKGKMHSYMRMYWAKKILEWTNTPEEALEIAIYLNDKYSLDGLDPNGYTGILWSIGGLHDRAWFDRSVFGKIRYMNYEGCKRKFDVDLYINNMNNI